MSAVSDRRAPDTLLAAATLPRRHGAWYVAEHQLRAMRSYGWTIVISGIGTPLMYLLGIGLGLATFLATPVGYGPDGPVPYVVFVAPALLVSATVSVATEEFTYTVMSGFKWRRVFWGMNASPVAPGQIASGLVIAAGLRMVFVATAYAALTLAFDALGRPVAVLVLPLIGVLAGLAFGMPLLAYAASLTDDNGQFAAVQRFVFTPMFLFSGTFYPIEALPTWLHWIGWVSPLWHASELGRLVSYGAPMSTATAVLHLAVLLVMAGGGWVVARRTFVGRLRG
ncbi:MAG TPA: ABC transporter permease [Actinotalea sp.]|nr:ABC transporter permease [Actinotalea sp.]